MRRTGGIKDFTSTVGASTTLTACGDAFNRSVNSVIIPSVPSDPTNSSVKLYPAEVFLSMERVKRTKGRGEEKKHSIEIVCVMYQDC